MITSEAFRDKGCFTPGGVACVCPSFRARILRGERMGVASRYCKKALDLYRGFQPTLALLLRLWELMELEGEV